MLVLLATRDAHNVLPLLSVFLADQATGDLVLMPVLLALQIVEDPDLLWVVHKLQLKKDVLILAMLTVLPAQDQAPISASNVKQVLISLLKDHAICVHSEPEKLRILMSPPKVPLQEPMNAT